MPIGQEKQQPRWPSAGERLTNRRVVVTGLLCLIIPILFFTTASQLTRAKGPAWLPPSFENPYAYLFNSLLLLDGHAPYHIDHPGTTTQVFGAFVLRVCSTESPDQLIRSVIQQPEKYLREIHQTLLIFTVLTLWLLPWMTALVIRNYLIGILIQAPILFYHCLLSYALFFGSDLMVVPFSIATVCFCSLLIGPLSAPRQLDLLLGLGIKAADTTSMRVVSIRALPALTGLACALGIATKLTFFPLILISLFCCRTFRNLVTFTTAFMLSLAVVLLPIYSELAKLSTWIFDLGVHSGTYGHGEVGLPGTAQYTESVRSLFEAEPLVVAIPLVAGVGALVLSFANAATNVRSTRISWKTALPLLGLQVVSFLAVAKHPSRQYLIPLCVSTGFSLVLLFYVLRSANGAVIRRVAGWITLTGLLFLGSKSFIELAPQMYEDLHEAKAQLLGLYRHAKELTQNDVRVDYYFSDSPVFPLCFGNDYSRQVFGPILASQYPNALFFSVFNNRFETFTSFIEPEKVLAQHDHLYFLGNPTWLHKGNGLDPGTFETIDTALGFSLQKWTRK
jgi:hypothetical protein